MCTFNKIILRVHWLFQNSFYMKFKHDLKFDFLILSLQNMNMIQYKRIKKAGKTMFVGFMIIFHLIGT